MSGAARLALALAVTGPVSFAAPLRAQTPDLAGVDSLLAVGEVAGARTTLERWWATGQRATGSRRAHALYLRAIVRDDFAAAESDLLDVVLGHPTAPDAPAALLRLGQGLLARHDGERALGYLHRLVTDYPSSPEHDVGVAWLARAQRQEGAAAVACRTLDAAPAHAGADAAVAALLKRERAACTGASGPSGRYAVQIGAFRDSAHAAALARRVSALGFEPRVVTVGRGSLLRVRVGRLAAGADAGALLGRLRKAGLDGVVVNDAAEENAPH